MKKKGFTLIELMAVIIVLGILAIITTPIMSDVLETSRKRAFEDSVYGLIKSVNLDKADSGFNVEKTYTLTNGVISPDINTKGSVNGTGTIKTDLDGQIYVSIQYDKWCADKDYSESRVVVTEGTCLVNSETTTANVPYLFSNMIPVRFDGTKWVKANKRNPTSSPWYNYGSKLWANAVVVKEVGTKTRDYYLSDAAVDQEVKEADVLAYFVWIPRFKYAIPGALQINVVFESGIPDKATGNAVGTNYLTHPGFTFGNEELTGIWVSKFSATGTFDNVTSKPNLTFLKTVGQLDYLVIYYSAINNMQLTNNAFGFNPSKMDLHIMKNNEWGVVSYLANSIYGKNSQIWRNVSNYISGCGATTFNDCSNTTCQTYTTTNGLQASTTGNVTGVYDMVARNGDIVMANYNGMSGSSGFNNFPLTKYYDKYTTTVSTTACNGGICYGQGLSETAGWYSGQAGFVDSSFPWSRRGGTCGTPSSIFADGNSLNQNYTGWQGDMNVHLTLVKD